MVSQEATDRLGYNKMQWIFSASPFDRIFLYEYRCLLFSFSERIKRTSKKSRSLVVYLCCLTIIDLAGRSSLRYVRCMYRICSIFRFNISKNYTILLISICLPAPNMQTFLKMACIFRILLMIVTLHKGVPVYRTLLYLSFLSNAIN